MPLSGRPRCDGHGPPIGTPYFRFSASRLMWTRLNQRPPGSPTGSGKTYTWRHLGSRVTNSRCSVSQLTTSSHSKSQTSLSAHQIDCSGRLYPIRGPNGVITRTDSTAQDTQRDAFLSSSLSTDAAHILLTTHPSNLLFLFQWTN